jgi:hypothetical protein
MIDEKCALWALSNGNSCICGPHKISHEIFIIMAFLCHGALPFPTIPPLLPLSPQNPLDHVMNELTINELTWSNDFYGERGKVSPLSLENYILGTSTFMVPLSFFP